MLPEPLPVKPDPLGLRFERAYEPGAKDSRGRIIAATEANHLVAHNGMLFASFGATYRRPPTPDPDFEGFAVLRKESADGPWLVDHDLGPRPFRVEALASLTFTTDANGKALSRSVARLLASRWSPSRTVLVRDDASGTWVESVVARGERLPAGGVFTARSFGQHVDRVTGVSSIYAGVWVGESGAVGEYRSSIYRAVHDEKAPGHLRWLPEPELTGVGRVMAFARANGDLYASCCILDESPNSGGIFRRIDGPSPRWELVYRWKEYDLTVWDDEQRMMRGLTAVPDTANPAKEVLIGFRYFPTPIIERIDPQHGHKATVELDLRDFFGEAFHGGGTYTGVIRAAYNPFTPFIDRRSGKAELYLCGVQVYHPGFPKPPHNGSNYLVRRSDGTYDWGRVFDDDHPVPEGRSLDATREIVASPFDADNGRVLYFAGYDGPYVDNRTAWIYRGTIRDGENPGKPR
jgi:hypothetical protein